MNERKWNAEAVEAGEFQAFRQIVAALRAPDGCPWDREQTMESLKPCMINEMTEALAAIDIYRETKCAENLCEELGDVLLQVVLLAQIAQEEGLFTMEDVIRAISRKMLRRHPHVFGETGIFPEIDELVRKYQAEYEASGQAKKDMEQGMTAGEIPGLWAAIKCEEKKDRTPEMEQLEKLAFQESAREVARHLAQKCDKK